MSYQIKRSTKIKESLDLCNENGEVAETVEINIDIDAIAAELRRRLTAVITAEKLLKKADKSNFQEAYDLYAQTVTDVFTVCFGQENTSRIISFYEKSYIEAAINIVPFIYDVILPRTEEAIRNRKAAMKRKFRYR